MNVESNLEPTFLLLRDRLCCSDIQAAKLFVKCPQLLASSFSKSINPKVNWFQNSLDLTPKQLGAIIQHQPNLLLKSIEERMKPNLHWLQNRLDLQDGELKNLVRRAPETLGYRWETMEQKLQWYQDQFALDDVSSLRAFVCRYPTLLGYNTKTNVGPKIEFYKEHLGNDELNELIRKSPMALGVSLEKRLKPRLEEAQEVGIPMDLRLMRYIVTSSKKKWIPWLSKEIQKVQ